MLVHKLNLKRNVVSLVILISFIISTVFSMPIKSHAMDYGTPDSNWIMIDYPNWSWFEDKNLPGVPIDIYSDYEFQLYDWADAVGYHLSFDKVEEFINNENIRVPVFVNGQGYLNQDKTVVDTMRDIIFLESVQNSIKHWEDNYLKDYKSDDIKTVSLRAERIYKEIIDYERSESSNLIATIALLSTQNNVYNVQDFVTGQFKNLLTEGNLNFELDSGLAVDIPFTLLSQYFSNNGTAGGQDIAFIIDATSIAVSSVLGSALGFTVAPMRLFNLYLDNVLGHAENTRKAIHLLAHYYFSTEYTEEFTFALKDYDTLTSETLYNAVNYIAPENDAIGQKLTDRLFFNSFLLTSDQLKAVYSLSYYLQTIPNLDLNNAKYQLVKYLDNWYRSKYNTVLVSNVDGPSNLASISIPAYDVNSPEHGTITNTNWDWTGANGTGGNLEGDFPTALSNTSYIEGTNSLISFDLNLLNAEALKQDGKVRVTMYYEDGLVKSGEVDLVYYPQHSSVSLSSGKTVFHENEAILFNVYLGGETSYKTAILHEINTENGNENIHTVILNPQENLGNYAFSYSPSKRNLNLPFGLYRYYLEVDGFSSNDFFSKFENPDDEDNDNLPDEWELAFFEDIYAWDGDADPEGDGKNNYIEWELGTHPELTGIDEIIKTIIVEDPSDLYGEVYTHVQLYDALDLNGQNLIIHGNLEIEVGGFVDINGGTLTVGGDLIAKGWDGGYLKMTNEDDRVYVNGDFIIEPFNLYDQVSGELTAGVLDIKGDFEQQGDNTRFNPQGTHKVVLSGNEIQTVRFNRSSSNQNQFNILEITNDQGVILETDSVINNELIGNIASLDKTKLQFNLEAYEKLDDWIYDIYLPAGGTWQLTHDMILPAVDLYVPWSTTLNLNGYSMSVNGNVYQNGDIFLNAGNMEVNGDLTISSGTMDLDAGNLTVNNIEMFDGLIDLNSGNLNVLGNLDERSGMVDINRGTLVVNNDYRLLDYDKDEDKDNIIYVDDNYSILKMVNDLDKVIVNGNFLTRSSVDHNNYLTAGTMEIKGDFTQEESYLNYAGRPTTNNFYPSGSHKVVLSGTGLQNISFETGGIYWSLSRFNILELNNISEAGVVFDTAVAIDDQLINTTDNINGIENIRLSLKALQKLQDWNDRLVLSRENGNWALTQDVMLPGAEMQIDYSTLNLNGYSLTIGNIVLKEDGTVNVNGGNLTVEGSLTQEGGDVEINGGTLVVKADYLLAKEDIALDGNTVYHDSDGLLVMNNENDYVKVDGNFVAYGRRNRDYSFYLKAGILDIMGDFIGRAKMSENHMVILSGTGIQRLDGIYELYFNTLEITNSSEEGIVFENSVVIAKLFEHNQNNFLIKSLYGSQFPDYDGDGIKDNEDLYPTILSTGTIPQVIGLSPLDGVSNVLINEEISATFSVPVTVSNLNNISIVDSNGDAVSNISASLTSDSKTLVIFCNSFAYGITYTVNIPNGTIQSKEFGVPNDSITWSFTIQSFHEIDGDFNGNGYVDIADLAILSQAYGTKSGNDNFNDSKDINSDGIIDIYDLVNLAKKIK